MLQKKMNNKGFTLIELLIVVVLIAIISGIAVNSVGSTMSVGKREAYNIMKDNIVTAGYNYINECTLGSLECNFSFSNNNTFFAKTLQEVGFFDNLESPIDGKYLGSCLVLKATKSNGVVVVDIIDNCY